MFSCLMQWISGFWCTWGYVCQKLFLSFASWHSLAHTQNGTHGRVLFRHCPFFESFLEMDTCSLNFWDLDCQCLHSTSQGLPGCFIHQSKNWDSKVRLRLEVPLIHLQSINLTRPAAVDMCAFQEFPYTSVSWRKRVRKFKFWYWFAKSLTWEISCEPNNVFIAKDSSLSPKWLHQGAEMKKNWY